MIKKSAFIRLIVSFFTLFSSLVLTGQECYVISLDHYTKSFPAAGGSDLVYLGLYPYGCTPYRSHPNWISLDWWSEDLCYIECANNTGSARNGYVYFGDLFLYVSQAAGSTPLTAGTISGTAAVCYNTSPGTLTGTSASGGSCGTSYSYQWQVSSTSASGGFNNISGATSLNFAAPAQTDTLYYRRKVTCSSESAYSNVLTINAYTQLSAGTISGDQVIMSGSIPTTLTSVSLGTGGGGTVNYQWYSSQNSGVDWSTITNATDTSYPASSGITSTTLFKRRFTNTCGSVYSNTVTVIIGDRACLDKGQNYIYTMEPLTEVSDSASLFSLSYDSVRQSVVYYDGLGRPMQNNLIFGSPGYKDIITPITYDSYGREAKKYLPFTAGVQCGLYSDTAIISQSRFYTELFPNDIAYAETVFENSPLNRILRQGAPGASWQPGQHPVRYDYGINTIADSVILWRVNFNDSLIREGDYNQGRLSKIIVKDENWVSGVLHTTEEYKDFQGKVVLKRNYVLDSESNIDTVETYYVYDDFNLLRYVLPPEAINNLGLQEIFTCESDLIKDWCYYYKYDGRKRMIIKQLPGADPVYLAYDPRDRLVLTQDGNMRHDTLWFFTKYDVLNRPVLTGVLKTNSTVSLFIMQDSIDDAYSGSSARDFYVTRYNPNPSHMGYTNTSFPNTSDDSITYYTATYYDDYDYLGSKEYESGFAIGNTTHLEEVKGLVTGTKALVLDGGDTYLTTTTYYDEKYRPVQALQDLYDLSNGSEITSNSYDFTGKILASKTIQTVNDTARLVIKYYTYDHMGRLLKIRQEANDTTVVLSEMGYNDLGQLDEKKLHVSGSTALQTINYEYNIRGWLTAINDPTYLGSDLFSMELCYDNSSIVTGLTTQAQYNGNISGIRWKSTGDSNIKGYGYSYDALNRLTSSDYGEGSSFTTNQDMFNESIGGYDLNGNIKSLDRIGLDGTTQLTLDSLTYVYSGNQLQRIIDAASKSLGFIDTTNTYDYDYDLNGNLTQDLNKGISNIEYNYLNLPSKVKKDGIDSILFIYDAMGMKLKKISTNDGTPIARYYAGVFEYDEWKDLDLIHTEEGVVNVTGSTYDYEYFLKDHLGNTRVTFKPNGSSLDTLQKVNYYPFGMIASIENYGLNNKYLYNGKELQDDLIDGKKLDWYDYGARFYDPQIGRTLTQDPHQESYFSISPYSYFGNNPLIFIDPSGEDIKFYIWVEELENGASKWRRKEVTYSQLDKNFQKVLETFAKTDAGKEYLGYFAKAGDKIGSVEFKNDGKFSKHELDIGQMNSNYTSYGYEDFNYNPSKLFFYINVNMERENKTTEAYSVTMGHEAFIHQITYLEKLIEAYDKGDLATVRAIQDKQQAIANDRRGRYNHDGYLEKRPEYSNMYNYLSQLKTLLNPVEVTKAIQIHDQKFWKEYKGTKLYINGKK